MRICIGFRLIYVGLLGVALGCGSTTEPFSACSGPVSITVSGGTTPTFEWTPQCGAHELAVVQPRPPSQGFGEDPRWLIRAERRFIQSPVRYGQTPDGAAVGFDPQQLEAGRTYRVSVGTGVTSWGSTMFTP
jgi:hypothetical protein